MTEPTIRLTPPLTDAVVAQLHAGDSVRIEGTIYVARDAAHKRLVAALADGQALPFDPVGQLIIWRHIQDCKLAFCFDYGDHFITGKTGGIPGKYQDPAGSMSEVHPGNASLSNVSSGPLCWMPYGRSATIR